MKDHRPILTKIGNKSFLVTFAVTFGSLVLLGFLASISFSKSYWGYFLAPPGLPKKVLEFEEILSVTPVSSQEQDNPSLSRSPKSLNWCESEPSRGDKHPRAMVSKGNSPSDLHKKLAY